MNILLINHYAGSPYYGMEFRPYYLAREWIKQGHKVTILGASFSHLRQYQPEVEQDFHQEDIDGIKYMWIKTPQYGGSLSRIQNIMTFVWKLQRHAKKIVELFNPDLVIASSTYPFDNIPAHTIAKFAGAKYTYEIHDIWPLGPIVVGGYSKWNPFIMMMQYAEDYAYRHTDKVVSLLWNAEEHCIERGLPKGKFVSIPNGYFPEEWTDDKLSLALPEVHQKTFDSLKGKTIVGFAGGFAASGNVITLVKAAVNLKETSTVHIVLVGKGPELPTYQKVIKDSDLTNVTILPAVPKSLIPSTIRCFDIAYLGGVHSILHKYGTSYNKMTDYMLSSLPIVQSVDEPGSVVERVGCGLRVEAENVDEVTKAIRNLASLSRAERLTMGAKGKRYVEENLAWSKLSENFINEFK